MRFLCWQCRRPNATLALRPRPGYADGPRPSCEECYQADDGYGRYARNRFAGGPLSTETAEPQAWLLKWKADDP